MKIIIIIKRQSIQKLGQCTIKHLYNNYQRCMLKPTLVAAIRSFISL